MIQITFLSFVVVYIFAVTVLTAVMEAIAEVIAEGIAHIIATLFTVIIGGFITAIISAITGRRVPMPEMPSSVRRNAPRKSSASTVPRESVAHSSLSLSLSLSSYTLPFHIYVCTCKTLYTPFPTGFKLGLVDRIRGTYLDYRKSTIAWNHDDGEKVGGTSVATVKVTIIIADFF